MTTSNQVAGCAYSDHGAGVSNAVVCGGSLLIFHDRSGCTLVCIRHFEWLDRQFRMMGCACQVTRHVSGKPRAGAKV